MSPMRLVEDMRRKTREPPFFSVRERSSFSNWMARSSPGRVRVSFYNACIFYYNSCIIHYKACIFHYKACIFYNALITSNTSRLVTYLPGYS